MNGYWIKRVTITCIFCLSYLSAQACTNIVVKAKDGSMVVARTMEFGPNLNSSLIVSPRGELYSNTAPNGKPSLSWKGQYGYVYMNGFGLDLAVDGMNEKGLSFGALYLPGFTQYQALPKDPSHAIPYYQFGDWVLGNFNSVAEVKTALKHISVFAQGLNVPGHPNAIFPLHVIITDATGKSIVVEWNQGKMQVFDNPLGILTNSPTFDWQAINLKNYSNLSPYSLKTIKISGFEYSGTGQGSGMVGLPGDSTPPSRFVKMFALTQSAIPVANAEKALVLAEHIINNVDIPRGLVRGEQGEAMKSLETTQWTVFKDLTNRVLYFKSYAYPTLRSVDLNKLDLSVGAKPQRLQVEQAAPAAIDVTSSLVQA